MGSRRPPGWTCHIHISIAASSWAENARQQLVVRDTPVTGRGRYEEGLSLRILESCSSFMDDKSANLRASSSIPILLPATDREIALQGKRNSSWREKDTASAKAIVVDLEHAAANLGVETGGCELNRCLPFQACESAIEQDRAIRRCFDLSY